MHEEIIASGRCGEFLRFELQARKGESACPCIGNPLLFVESACLLLLSEQLHCCSSSCYLGSSAMQCKKCLGTKCWRPWEPECEIVGGFDGIESEYGLTVPDRSHDHISICI